MALVSKMDHRVILETLQAIGGSRALSVAIMFRYGMYTDIVNLTFTPSAYNDVDIARRALAATELLRKHEELPTGIDLKQVALEKFFEAEARCEETNERLRGSNSHDQLIISARRKIADILGDFVPDEMFDLAGWGPGVTLSLRGRHATPTNKFRRHAELTQPLLRLATRIQAHVYPTWNPKFRVFEGNRIITVPKNAKTDRVIAVEPSLNLWYQKGIGAMIRRRLLRERVDLRNQEVNQKFAKIGSKHQELATVDFSAASDTISFMTVLELLPIKWVEVLTALRSPRGFINDSLIEYEKFSSMGNGYTFELESLLFYAITKCVCADHPLSAAVNIYGDDLICPSDMVGPLVDAFSFFGFKLNESKSFHDGYYRESCGKHYWDGIDITPIYLRRYLSRNGKPLQREVYAFHNRIVDLSRLFIADGFRDKRFTPVLSLLKTCLPEKERLAVPIGMGDGGFVSDWNDILTGTVRKPKFCKEYQTGYFTKSLIFIPQTEEEDDDALMLNQLYGLWKRHETESDTPSRNSVTVPRHGRYAVRRMYVRDWPELGHRI